ncbi:unnamed protein product [Durusdinium trenchii]|uniref:Uncharacterized protein n=1 Tax=Durusdinium trenchii TaxID=1381693 RepID=A0ABP0M667_9DINO
MWPARSARQLRSKDPLVRWPWSPCRLHSWQPTSSKELCTAPRGRRLAQTGGAKDVLVRSFVLSVLARLEDPDYLSPEASTLASCLEDVAWKVRRGACQALGWCHSAAVAPHAAALARCVDDDDARVARSALGALRRCGDWALRPWAQLLAEHFDEEDEKMRTAALVAFAQIKGAEVLSPHATALAASAHGSEPGPVRRASCQALSRCHPQVLQPYLHLLAPYMEDQDLEVRIAVCQAFAKCDPSFIAPYVSPLARRLKDCLLVRWNACRALLECKPALLLPHLDLLTELLQDHNKQVRQLAQRLLARCFPEASPKT